LVDRQGAVAVADKNGPSMTTEDLCLLARRTWTRMDTGPEVLQGHPAVDCSPAQLPAEPNRSIIVWWSQTPGNMQIQRVLVVHEVELLQDIHPLLQNCRLLVEDIEEVHQEVMEEGKVKIEKLLFSPTLTLDRLLKTVVADSPAAEVNHIHQFTDLDLQLQHHQEQ